MEDVANGQEPCKIPLYANAPSTAVSKLRDSFEYVTDWILPDGLVDSLSDASEDASAYACNCEDAPCTNTTIDCSCVVDYGYFYESGTPARLRLDSLPSHHTIYECCSQCSCRVSSTCRNDITQRGVQIKCSVRWTGEREFGLFAEEDIPKGAFLCCYIGEIISTAEARRRFESQMKSEQSNYILILREETNVKGRRQILKTSIDASVKGNISHFLNHACPPLATHVVLPVRTVGTLIPRPSFFSVRDIKAGEELTWDYGDAGGETWLFGKTSIAAEEAGENQGRTPCICGSPLCRKWLAFDPTL